jgi:hypothetical protein
MCPEKKVTQTETRKDPGRSDRKINDPGWPQKKWPNKRQDKVNGPGKRNRKRKWLGRMPKAGRNGETGKGNDKDACLRRGEKVKRKVSMVPV